MITYHTGNLLEDQAEALVNTVNCVGVMGKGIALQFKQAFQDNFRAYERACKADSIHLGQVFVFQTGSLVNPKFIINFPTKKHWKGHSKIGDIKSGLDDLVHQVRQLGITSIALPPLGCGLGGLQWAQVAPLIHEAFKDIPDVDVHVYAPGGAPAAADRINRTSKPNMTRSRAMFLALLDRYGVAGYSRSLLEVQKLAYFLQEAGEPLALGFVRHHYGPYSEKLNHVLQRMEGHYIRGYLGERNPDHEIQLLGDALGEAASALEPQPDAVERINKVTRLIEGFESPAGLELLATVHWLAKHSPEQPVTESFLLHEVQGWSPRKKRLFRPEHIHVASDQLREQGWIA